MTGTVSPVTDVTRTVSAHRNLRNENPRQLRMAKITLRTVALAAGLHEAEVDRVIRDWEGGTLLGIPLVLDPTLRAGAIATEALDSWPPRR